MCYRFSLLPHISSSIKQENPTSDSNVKTALNHPEKKRASEPLTTMHVTGFILLRNTYGVHIIIAIFYFVDIQPNPEET